MEIKLDLGSDLALEGQGITTRLEGELTVRSNAIGSDPFSVFGEVRTVEGRYRAWGQALNVETGVVRFNGPYANPVARTCSPSARRSTCAPACASPAR